jgi:hypothetical protein
MKKHILTLSILFFSMVGAMDKPEDGSEKNESENRKLLFLLPEKNQKESRDEWWKLVRQNYVAEHYWLESDACSLPREIKQNIWNFCLKLRNPSFFNLSADQLSQRMLYSCMMLSFKEKAWNLPIDLSMTHDGKYYLAFSEDVINIYDAKTKECIKSILGKNKFCVCKKGNLIFLKDQEKIEDKYKYSLYDIEKDLFYDLGEWGFWSKCCAKYVVGFDDGNFLVWDITNVDALVCHKIPCANGQRNFVEITSDDDILFGPGDGTIMLLSVEDGGLKELARYDSQGLLQSGTSTLSHYDESDYLILGRTKSLGIKIEKSSDAIALKEVFFLPGEVCSVVGKDTVLSSSLVNTRTAKSPMFSIMNYSGEVIQTGEFMCTGSVYFADQLLYGGYESLYKGERALVMMHVARDNEGYGTHFVKKVIRDINPLPFCYEFNRKKALFLAEFVPEDDFNDFFGDEPKRFGCFDAYGKEIASFDAKKVDFHPCGYAVLLEKEDGSRKKCNLWPKGADDHFKKLAHKPLTLAQYASLETLCGEVEKKRLMLQEKK